MDGISTIMPVYLSSQNEKELGYLSIAINSILIQTVDLPLELILVDDASPVPIESIKGVLPVLADPRVRIIRQPFNQKLVSALNVGLKASKYALIARLDADDVWRPGKLAAQLALMRSDPELTLVATSMRLLHEDPKYDRDEIRSGSWDEVLKLFDRGWCPFPHGSILARREVFEILGGYPTDPVFAHCEDMALWLVWVRFFKTAILQDVYLDYRINPVGVSGKYAASQARGSRLLAARYKDWISTGTHVQTMLIFAETHGLSQYIAGVVLYLAWQYHGTFLVNHEDQVKIKSLFPDRRVIAIKSGAQSCIDLSRIPVITDLESAYNFCCNS